MDRKSKNNIFKDNFFAAVALFLIFARVNCDKVSLNQLTVGDVVNDINLDQFTNERVGNLFNGETAAKYVKNETLQYLRTHSYIMGFECNNISASGYFPDIKINASKKIGFDDNKLNSSVLGVDDQYLDKKYFCVSFKNCVVKVDDSVLIDLNNGGEYPEDVKNWIDQTGLSGHWRENETCYVSSVLTGDCVFQILVYDEPKEPGKVFDWTSKTPIYKGHVSSASHNATLEKWTNDFLGRIDQSLGYIDPRDNLKIFEQLNNVAIIQMKLQSLPAIPSQH